MKRVSEEKTTGLPLFITADESACPVKNRNGRNIKSERMKLRTYLNSAKGIKTSAFFVNIINIGNPENSQE